MGSPQSLEDFELPILLHDAGFPTWLYIEVEGTAEQLPRRLARMLRLHGFEVKIVEAEGEVREEQ